MSETKNVLNNLILCKKNIKRKVLDMKRGVIDSNNYFSETFKPIIDPLNTIIENKNELILRNINTDKNENDGQHDYVVISDFEHFLKASPQSRTYDRSYGLHYDVKDDKVKIANFPVTFINGNLKVLDKYYPWTIGLWSLLCEKIPKNTTFNDVEAYYDILKSTKVHLKSDGKPKTSRYFKWVNIVKPLHERIEKEKNNLNKKSDPNTVLNLNDFSNRRQKNQLDLDSISRSYIQGTRRKKAKYSNELLNQTGEKSFSFSLPTDDVHSSTGIDENLINFTNSKVLDQTGSGLYKDVIRNTQLVYYDDPNELVTRLNLLMSSQNAGNTGVNNEIISILEELRERKLIM